MLLSVDLSGADWVTTAYVCRDPAMLDVARSGRSPHQVTGARMCGVSEEVVVKEDKIVQLNRDPEEISRLRKEHFPGLIESASFLPRTMSIRQAAKKANHGLNFAETYRTFALLNELEEREAKRIVYAYTCNCANFCGGRTCKCAYPGVREWWDRTDAQLRKTRRITNCFGRTVYFMGQIGKDMFKQGYAFVPQSTTGDCCNHGMRAMFEDASPYFRPAELLAQVHDSLLVQYLSRNWTDMAAFAVKLGREYMRPELNYGEPYRLGTDLKVGFDWAAMVEVKLSDDVDVVAVGLAAAHDKLMGMKKAA